MQTLRGKKVLITSGGTLEKWDNVRGHTNLSKGAMGCFLAEAALTAGAEVIYLHGYFAKLPDNASKMRLMTFEGIEDLGAKIQSIVQNEFVDFVIMAAAGSDWIIDKVYDQSGNLLEEQGKMPSDEPPIIHFKKAPKVLGQIKGWSPDTTLIGFKLEATDDVDYLISRAQLRMDSSKAGFMVANSSKSLYGMDEPHFIIAQSGEVVRIDGKEKTAKKLVEILANR
ncbi:phosphopantothenoylcysteine decarboxylase [Ureibacillus aquaedulcis]|uniref:Phosphopantothenoylcysteine decarboxylase n=1 Tax=Ureibacillus aquaedulcis TaxID=3058421 RepID=A0ABT8GQV2_9BACL|nr:phosphopantothenoylcysteine decarboxylase [Ureibacillus sp. BA0131]MDN4493790.1 phosphopantothenoylcysteine decarboxylase [Ureibacillus sp. BA0131]